MNFIILLAALFQKTIFQHLLLLVLIINSILIHIQFFRSKY